MTLSPQMIDDECYAYLCEGQQRSGTFQMVAAQFQLRHGVNCTTYNVKIEPTCTMGWIQPLSDPCTVCNNKVGMY